MLLLSTYGRCDLLARDFYHLAFANFIVRLTVDPHRICPTADTPCQAAVAVLMFIHRSIPRIHHDCHPQPCWCRAPFRSGRPGTVLNDWQKVRYRRSLIRERGFVSGVKSSVAVGLAGHHCASVVNVDGIGVLEGQLVVVVIHSRCSARDGSHEGWILEFQTDDSSMQATKSRRTNDGKDQHIARFRRKVSRNSHRSNTRR